jgi:hypothetical protein
MEISSGAAAQLRHVKGTISPRGPARFSPRDFGFSLCGATGRPTLHARATKLPPLPASGSRGECPTSPLASPSPSSAGGAHGIGVEGSPPVFCDELGGPIHPQRLTEWFRRHRTAADIPTGTLHTLRHSHATLALTSGVPVHIVAARLGDTPTTVLNTYAHLLPSSDEGRGCAGSGSPGLLACRDALAARWVAKWLQSRPKTAWECGES